MKAIASTLVTSIFLVVSSYGQFNPLTTKNKATMETLEISQSILKTLEDAWNNADGAAFSQPFADTCEFVDIRGSLHKNSSPTYIGDAHQGLFMSIYKDSKVVYQLVQAIFIDNHTILVNAQTELDSPAGPLAGKNFSTVTLILVKSASVWKIRGFHNTLVVKR